MAQVQVYPISGHIMISSDTHGDALGCETDTHVSQLSDRLCCESMYMHIAAATRLTEASKLRSFVGAPDTYVSMCANNAIPPCMHCTALAAVWYSHVLHIVIPYVVDATVQKTDSAGWLATQQQAQMVWISLTQRGSAHRALTVYCLCCVCRPNISESSEGKTDQPYLPACSNAVQVPPQSTLNRSQPLERPVAA